MGLPPYDGDSYLLADFLYLAQRRRCAAAILALLFADIFRRLPLGASYTPAKAVSAAFKPDNCQGQGLLPHVDPSALPTHVRKELKEVGWTKDLSRPKSREEGWAGARLCNVAAQGTLAAEGSVQAGSGEGADGAGIGTVGDYLL